MKYLLALILIYSSLFSSDQKQELTLGFGPYIQTQPYNNVDSIIVPSPVIFFDNELLYVRWTRVGMYFLGDKENDFSWGLSLTTQPRIYGYDSHDIPGMNERKTSWEGGLAFSAKADKAYIEIMALTDILDRYENWLTKVDMGYDFKLGKFSFYPSIFAIYQSDDFMNYYYGVRASEAIIRSENEYIAKAGLQVGIQTYVSYPLTKKLSVFMNLRADRLPSSAISSSIVEDDYIYSGLASLIYTFEY